MNPSQICLIIAVVCFAIGTFPRLTGSEIHWQNAGLGFVTLSLVLG